MTFRWKAGPAVQISDYLERAMVRARSTKEWACKKRPDDLCPYIDAYRGDELIAVVTLRNHRREEILEAAVMCALGFDADVIGLVIETYTACYASKDAGLNPLTGKEWEPGGMQDVAENHQGIQKGWINEALMATVANRAGDVGAKTQSYRYSGKYLVWEDDTPHTAEFPVGDSQDKQMQGLIPSVLRRAMATPSASQILVDGWELADRADRDILTAQALNAKFQCAPLLTAHPNDTNRVQKLKKVGVTITPPR